MEKDLLQRALYEWSADTRINQARITRRSQQIQQQTASDEARFSGLLLDLHEDKAPVSLKMAGGRRVNGLIVETGRDFIELHSNRGSRHFIRIDAVVSIEIDNHPRNTGAPSLRSIEEQRDISAIVADLIDNRIAVRFASKDTDELRSCAFTALGVDVVTAELAGSPARTLFIALDQVSEIVIQQEEVA